MKLKIVQTILPGNMDNYKGKFIIGENTSLHIEDISKEELVCSFHSLLNYRVIGDINTPNALDPSGGPFIEKGNFHINEWDLKEIKWNDDKKVYLLTFEK